MLLVQGDVLRVVSVLWL